MLRGVQCSRDLPGDDRLTARTRIAPLDPIDPHFLALLRQQGPAAGTHRAEHPVAIRLPEADVLDPERIIQLLGGNHRDSPSSAVTNRPATSPRRIMSPMLSMRFSATIQSAFSESAAVMKST